jgi:hypothetical protein
MVNSCRAYHLRIQATVVTNHALYVFVNGHVESTNTLWCTHSTAAFRLVLSFKIILVVYFEGLSHILVSCWAACLGKGAALCDQVLCERW